MQGSTGDSGGYAVVVVEPLPILRDRLVGLFGRDRARRRAVPASDARTLPEVARREDAELVVMEPAVLDGELPTALGALVRQLGTARVLAFGADSRIQTIQSLLQAGAAGYLPKASDAAQLLRGAQDVLAGRMTLPVELHTNLTQYLLARNAQRHTPRLSRREATVLSLAAEGCSSPEIGSRLYLAVPTVKTHLHNAYEKLGVHNRPSAVAAAIRLGLLDVDADPGTAADA